MVLVQRCTAEAGTGRNEASSGQMPSAVGSFLTALRFEKEASPDLLRQGLRRPYERLVTGILQIGAEKVCINQRDPASRRKSALAKLQTEINAQPAEINARKSTRRDLRLQMQYRFSRRGEIGSGQPHKVHIEICRGQILEVRGENHLSLRTVDIKRANHLKGVGEPH